MGTTDDFATSFLYFSMDSTALWDLANSHKPDPNADNAVIDTIVTEGMGKPKNNWFDFFSFFFLQTPQP